MGAEMEHCSGARVVKQINSKSIRLCPRRFEYCSLRLFWGSARDSNFVFVDRNRQHLMYVEWEPKWKSAAMSEWLRRLTRNQLGSARVGSNPARCESFAEVRVIYIVRLLIDTGIT